MYTINLSGVDVETVGVPTFGKTLNKMTAWNANITNNATNRALLVHGDEVSIKRKTVQKFLGILDFFNYKPAVINIGGVHVGGKLAWTLFEVDQSQADRRRIHYGADTLRDSYSETNQDASIPLSREHPTAIANRYSACGQTFTAGANFSLNKVTFYVRKLGNPTGNIYVKVYNSDGTHIPVGAAIATETYNLADFPGSFELKTFTFTTPAAIAAASIYCIVLETAGSGTTLSDDNLIYVGVDSTAGGHAGWEVDYHGTAPGWRNQLNYDTPFYIYSSVNSAATTILDDILAASSGFTRGDCPATEVEISFDYKNCLEAIKLLAERLGYDYDITDGKAVNLVASKGDSRGNLTRFTALSHKEDSGFPKLITRVYGLGNYDGSIQITSMSENLTAETTYGGREIPYVDRSLIDGDVLKVYTDLHLDTKDQPLDAVIGSISEEEFFDGGYATGDSFTVEEALLNIDDTYRLQSWSVKGPLVLLGLAVVVPLDTVILSVGGKIADVKFETIKEITQKIQSD